MTKCGKDKWKLAAHDIPDGDDSMVVEFSVSPVLILSCPSTGSACEYANSYPEHFPTPVETPVQQ